MIMDKRTLDRIEELKHRESLLYNCVDYLVMLWEINEKDKIVEKLAELGFTQRDIEDFEIVIKNCGV